MNLAMIMIVFHINNDDEDNHCVGNDNDIDSDSKNINTNQTDNSNNSSNGEPDNQIRTTFNIHACNHECYVEIVNNYTLIDTE